MKADRFDGIARALGGRRASPSIATIPAADARNESPLPRFRARALSGRNLTSLDLLAPGKPVLLIFTHPACGPCYELLPNVAGWQRVYNDRLTIVLVSAGTEVSNQAMIASDGIDPELLLLQDGDELAAHFGIEIAPAAVLLRDDERPVEKPVLGAAPIRQLVADTLGLRLPALEQRPATATLKLGDRLPALRRPTIDQTVFDIGAERDHSTLALFWSPGCQHCQHLLAEIRQWETAANDTRLLIISRGPIAINHQFGFRAPVILDDDHSLADLFGTTGTPAAVLIDAHGQLASPVAHGVRGTAALAARTFRPGTYS